MPQKINMVISNNNATSFQIAQMKAINTASLAATPKPPSSLNAPIISRIHNVKPGCGSCGRG